MAAIIPCDKCIHGKVCAMGFQFRRETANVTIVCKDIVRKTDVAPRAEVAREIFQEIYADLFRMLPLKVFHLISGDIVGDRFDAGKERALHDVIHCVAELEKKYAEGRNERAD